MAMRYDWMGIFCRKRCSRFFPPSTGSGSPWGTALISTVRSAGAVISAEYELLTAGVSWGAIQ